MPAVCEAGRVTSASGGEKVGVVVGDDHPLFREGVVRALSSSGPVDVVAEADDGLPPGTAATHRPQVALLDYRMPGMDGAQVAAAVRRDELPTRVLLVSAHDESAMVYKSVATRRRRIHPQGVQPRRAHRGGVELRQGPRRLCLRPRRRTGG